jgi:dolichol-phosphate mannosyltransferase
MNESGSTLNPPPDISLIIPFYNEEDCAGQTLREAYGVLGAQQGLSFEILAVDDGSTDRTREILCSVAAESGNLRVFSVTPNSGQSAAFGAGFARSRGRAILLMDGDGQNDPADIPRLVEGLKTHDVCCGFRHSRKDTMSKRLGSRLANAVRKSVLNDGIIDTGCSLKAFRSEIVRDFPMSLKGMHRFLPVLAQMRGGTVLQLPVNHRPRAAGRSKYTNWKRLRETVYDLWAIRWMQKRYRRFSVQSCA